MPNLNISTEIGTFLLGKDPCSGEKMLSTSKKNANDLADQLLKESRKDKKYFLKENMLHVWSVSLDQLQQFLPVLRQNLSEEELARAERYHFNKDRNRFILRRSILRILISNYLEVDAKHIQFCYGKRGKPRIANNYSAKPFNFNMSHSENLSLYAFTSRREVGIDIEYVRPIPEMAQIVESYFSKKEKTVFNGLPADVQKEFFFQRWTRKEAFLKATGKGLDQLDVISSGGSLQIQYKQDTSSRWHIEDLFPAPGFSAAYAVAGTSPLKCVFRWVQNIQPIAR